MKRRKFIEAALVTTASLPMSVAGAGRLYGEPGSVKPDGGTVTEKFKLPLMRAGMPATTIPTLASVSHVVESVLTSEKEARKFNRDPRAYMVARGLDGSDKTLLDDTMVVVTALAHPAVKSCLQRGDYEGLYGYLETAGLFEPRQPAHLQSELERVIGDNIEEIRKKIAVTDRALDEDQKQILLGILRDSGSAATEDDLAIVSQIASSGGVTIAGCTAVAMCLVAVGIAATVVLYVSAGVAVTVGIAVGVGISLAVAVAITVVSTNPLSVVEKGVSAPFTGKFARLDPALTRNAERAFRLAALTGDSKLQLHALKRLIREEVGAVIGAMRKTGLLQLSDEHVDASTEATALYAYKVLGLPS